MSTDLHSQSSMATGARQTMASWARVLESYADVPEIYQDTLKSLLEGRRTFPYVVLTPSFTGLDERTTEKLVCEVDDVVYILERAGDEVVVEGYPVDTIRDVEVGNILLYSWITLDGVTTGGKTSASTIEFNTATADRFAPFVDKLRRAPRKTVRAASHTEQAKFDALASASYKFMNYARSSLMSGEQVISMAWQPEIRVSVAPFLHLPFYRMITTAHLTVLTNKELILIREDERSSRTKKGMRYGGVWQYIPLRSVAGIALEQHTEELLALTIALLPGGRVDRLFAVSRRSEVEQLRDDMKRVIGQAIL
ncbi:MAG: hypothetical protein JXB35_00135 [Anaerolineae bacterium]|nr:hypothetical protein [Anaerolineae bacterium]